MSFQGKMNGNQAGDLFSAYNAKAGTFTATDSNGATVSNEVTWLVTA